jgi:hypothetical protein
VRLVIREELLWSTRKACRLNRKLLSCTTVAAANSALFYMPRDEFGHLEHADLALAVENRSERVVGVDLSSLGFVLKAVLLDVVPKLLSQFGTG